MKIISVLNTSILSKILFLLLFFGISQNINAQYKYNFNTLKDDFSEIVKQPTNWDKNDWLTIMGVAGLTYGTMYLDSEVRELVLNNHDYRNSIPVEFGRIWGEPLSSLAIAGSFYVHGLASDNNANKKLGFEIGESAFYSTLVTLLLKYSFGRERPRKNPNPFSFHPFSFKDDFFLSLSSGHTALAFSLSTVLAEHTSNDYLKVVAFIPAFMTAFSRIYQNHHWTSDVLLGGIIGYSVAEFVTRLHNFKSSKNSLNPIPQNPITLIDFRIPLR